MNRAALQEILADLNSSSADILNSAVVSIDGIVLASQMRTQANPDRVGGMSAALLSLGTRAAKELTGGKLKQVIIESDEGYTLVLQANSESILLLTAQHDAKLGMLLLRARQVVAQIAQEYRVD